MSAERGSGGAYGRKRAGMHMGTILGSINLNKNEVWPSAKTRIVMRVRQAGMRDEDGDSAVFSKEWIR